MLWCCQTSSTRNDWLDQYPIVCLPSTINILCAKGKNWAGCPAPWFFLARAPEFSVGVSKLQFDFHSLPVPWHSWCYPILTQLRISYTDLRNYVLRSCQYCVVSICQFSTSTVFQCQCSSDHSLRNIVENSFAASLMTIWCPCIWSW